MAISSASIFLSITIVALSMLVMAFASYGAGISEKNKESSTYKASVSFIGISGGIMLIAVFIVLYQAIVSKDFGLDELEL